MGQCPECGSTNLTYDENGLVCQKCGLIVESNLMFSEEFKIEEL